MKLFCRQPQIFFDKCKFHMKSATYMTQMENGIPVQIRRMTYTTKYPTNM